KDAERARVHNLHLPTGMILRRKLAAISTEGLDAFKKACGDEAAQKLAAARTAPDGAALLAALVDCGDRYFPLDEGAEALPAAGDLPLERGCLGGAAQAWRDILELHPSALARAKAGRRLVAILPMLADAATALDVAAALRHASLESIEGGEALATAAREIA